MADWNDLKQYIGSEDADEDSYIQSCYDEAVVLVDDALTNAFRLVPEVIRNRWYLEVGNHLYNRKNSLSGTSQFATFEGGATPVRSPRDPLAEIRPMIRRYVVPF